MVTTYETIIVIKWLTNSTQSHKVAATHTKRRTFTTKKQQ